MRHAWALLLLLLAALRAQAQDYPTRNGTLIVSPVAVAAAGLLASLHAPH